MGCREVEDASGRRKRAVHIIRKLNEEDILRIYPRILTVTLESVRRDLCSIVIDISSNGRQK